MSHTTDGSIAVVTGRPWRSTAEMVSKTYPQAATPATLVNLSDFSIIRPITDIGWTLEDGVISPDGSRIACLANQVGGARKRLIAFDAASGMVIARRKVPLAARLLFMPDSQTVAIGTSAVTESAPVEFWDVRGSAADPL